MRVVQNTASVAPPAHEPVRTVVESASVAVTTSQANAATAADATAQQLAKEPSPSAQAAARAALATAAAAIDKANPDVEPAQVAAAAAPGVTATSSPDAPALPVGSPKLSRGVVAYLRCDGVERPGERFPCPRDRALEERVWNSLSSLERCTADLAPGQGETRLMFRGGSPAKVSWRVPKGSGLNLRSVSKCVDSQLANTRSALRSRRLLVAFHFSMQ